MPAWTYIPRINAANSQEQEIYRDFNFGRAQAFAEAYDQGLIEMPWATRHMPATTGIGICIGIGCAQVMPFFCIFWQVALQADRSKTRGK